MNLAKFLAAAQDLTENENLFWPTTTRDLHRPDTRFADVNQAHGRTNRFVAAEVPQKKKEN